SIRVRSREQLGSGDQADHFSAAADPRPLGAAEKEQLVLDDSAAKRVAKLIAGEYTLWQTVGIVVKAVRGESRSPIELIKRAVEGVGSCFGRDVDDAARRPPVLGGEVARNNAELLHPVERNALPDHRGESVHVLTAIQQDVRARRALAVNGKTGAPDHRDSLVRRDIS